MLEDDAVIGARYRITGKLGEGGGGLVLACLDLRLGRQLAMKIVHPDRRTPADGTASQRLAREARILAAIEHPNVCAVLDAGSLDDGSPYFVMERLTGETVATRLARVGHISPANALRIAAQVLSVLEVAHGVGILHRDIKPSNVALLTPPGLPPIVKLFDFGAAKVLRAQNNADALALGGVTNEPLTAPGQVIGTASYLAPEQTSGGGDLDARTDLYQVGVLLYEMCSGRRPFDGASVAEVMRAVRAGGAPSLSAGAPALPAGLVTVVARAMAVAPESRFQSAAHFQEALAGLTNVAGGEISVGVDTDPAIPVEVDTELVSRRNRLF